MHKKDTDGFTLGMLVQSLDSAEDEKGPSSNDYEVKKLSASLRYRAEGATSFVDMRDLPGGKDNRPAERLIKGKKRKRSVGPSI